MKESLLDLAEAATPGERRAKRRSMVTSAGWKLASNALLTSAAERLTNPSQNPVFKVYQGSECFVSDPVQSPYAYARVGEAGVYSGGASDRMILCVKQ